MREIKEKGITLIALVVTIVVLLILAGITIGAITGDNGIINKTLDAKEKAEIANEKEIVDLATVQTMRNNKRGNIVKSELQKELDRLTGEGKTIVTEDTEEEGYFVKFVESGRIYKVDLDGNVEYLGKEDELLTQAEIIATPESSKEAKLRQEVDLEVKTPIEIEGAEYQLVYAWNQDKQNAPEDEKFMEATLTGEGRIRKTKAYSSATVGGDYYLWVRIVVGEIEKEACFGPYAIKDHTTLVSAVTETASTSGFLGSSGESKEKVKEIQRGLIKSVEIVDSLEGHSLSNDNTWDVTDSKNQKYLAWVEKDENGYYEITVGGEGGVVANGNSMNLFKYIGYGVENTEVTITGFENFETGLVTNMRDMFLYCKVSSLNLNSFDTSNVTSLFGTFQGCTNLKILEVNNWNTSNVTEMGEKSGYWSYGGIFQDCSSLTNLDISNWDTSKVTGMGRMFANCSSLTNLDLGNFNTGNVISMYMMFANCSKLQNLNIQNFNTDSVKYMGAMFQHCKGLKSISVEHFNTEKVETMNAIFQGCTAIKSIDVSGFNTSKVTNMLGMFRDCSNLLNIDLSNFDTSNVTNMNSMFYGCSNITELDVSGFNTTNVTNMYNMFNGCNNVRELDVSNFDTSNVTDMSFMFSGCSNVIKLDVAEFNTSNVTNMPSMFGGCNKLTDLDVSNFNTNQVTNMNAMFKGCNNITELNISRFNTSNVTNMQSMFHSCSKLTDLNVSNFNTNQVTNMATMFYGCSNLINLNVSGFDTNEVTNMSQMFFGCNNLTSLDLSSFSTKNVVNMTNIFYNCRKLSAVNISNFDMTKVENWSNMFMGVPTTVEITTNQETKNWILTNFPSYTNITVVQ